MWCRSMVEDRWHREKEAERRDFVSSLIEHNREQYERDHNPLCAWFAYLAARESGITPPAWTLRCLDEAARGIWELWQHAESGRKIGPTDIAKAVKLGGSRGKGNAFSNYGSGWMLFAETVAFYMRQGDQETYAIESVANDFLVSVSTVRREWKRFQAEYPERVIELLSSTKHPIS